MVPCALENISLNEDCCLVNAYCAQITMAFSMNERTQNAGTAAYEI